MVGVNKITLSFADRFLFNNVSFIINKQERIGLVGKNGAGKSTMLKILAGVQPADSGNISTPSDFSLGYLPQDMEFEEGRTVWEEAATVFDQLARTQAKIDDINHQLVTREDYESDSYMQLLDDLTHLNEELVHLDASNMDASIEQLLLGLGFKRNDFTRQTSEFSGGWRMRIELAKILLTNANLLLLDEPTNHLDIESIQWLEDFLKTYEGAIVLISHDRAFLDNVTNRTIEISIGKVYDYKAAYTKYMQLRQERREQEIAAFNNQQKQIKDTEDFIDRFRSKATKAVQVQSRIKQLDKIERIEIDVEDTSAMRFHFPPAPRSGKVALDVKDASKAYDSKQIFNHADISVVRGEKVAFVGKNGEGKSTMVKLIVGLENYTGSIEVGHNVSLGYYAQNQSETLDGNKTLFETIDEVATGDMRTKVRSLLGSFLFSGEDVDKKVKVLSGGERARLAFCKLLLKPINLLVLDEPTNHLDLRSKEILKDALKSYDGAMIVISHDRDFLEGLTEKVYEFKDGKVNQHIGDVYEFLRTRKVASFKEIEKGTDKPAPKAEAKPKEAQMNSQNLFELKKELKKECKSLKNSVQNAEKQIALCEGIAEKLNENLQNPSFYKDKDYDKVLKQWQDNNATLEETMGKWEVALEQLEIKTAELEKLG
ncbi:ATP-binding cassette domain-containing protein [Vicingaceae bacterium]|nr:ATP-binding cassette domain-containing protein [Vicingaceae bacterium]